jgi:hypothetical protein
MRRTRPALIAFFILALASLPVAARTAQLSSANGESADTADLGPSDEQAGLAAKPAAGKRTAAPGAAKNAAPAARGNGTAPVRAPRWHRFLPGMFR